MCEYCEKGKEIRNDNNIKSFISKAHFGYSIIVQTNKLYLDVQNIGFINYCPMCRKEARRKHMRGFNIGDFLQTRDGKHKGKVIKIENVIIENEVRIIITIRNDFEKYKADIDEFIIW